MKKIYGHHTFYFVGDISKVGDEQFVFAFSRMQRGNVNAQSCKMLAIMYNSLKLINNYFTKSNLCKMRERERGYVIISENGTSLHFRRYTTVYMIYVGIHVFFNEKKPFVTVCIVYM
jgi:hypothetical protein